MLHTLPTVFILTLGGYRASARAKEKSKARVCALSF